MTKNKIYFQKQQNQKKITQKKFHFNLITPDEILLEIRHRFSDGLSSTKKDDFFVSLKADN